MLEHSIPIHKASIVQKVINNTHELDKSIKKGSIYFKKRSQVEIQKDNKGCNPMQ